MNIWWINHFANPPTHVGGYGVYSYLIDRKKSVWYGNSGGALSIYHPWNDTWTHVRPDMPEKRKLMSWTVYTLCEDSEGYVPTYCK